MVRKKHSVLKAAIVLISLAFPVSIAFADTPTVSVTSLTPGSTVSVGNEITFLLAPSAFGGAVTYSLSDTFSGTTLTSNNINSSGTFVWIPTQSDAGFHTVTITATDGISTATVSQLITVNGTPAVSVQTIAPGTTVSPNTTLTFTVVPTSFQANPIYTLTDNANYSSLTSSNINSSGQFSWTPTTADIGQHNISIRVTDTAGELVNISEQIIVQGSGSLTLSAPTRGTSVPVGSSLSFNAIPTGFSPIAFKVSDTFASSSISNNNISQAGYFVWTPNQYDVGTHAVTITASEYGTTQTFATTTTLTVTPSTYVVAPTSTPAYTPTVVVSAPAAPAYVFSVYLKLGSRGADVSELQRILIKKGYLTGTATGYFGSLTMAAVKQYQAAHEIDRLGVVGPSTRVVLNAEESSSSPSSGNAAVIALLMQQVQSLLAQIAALKAAQH